MTLSTSIQLPLHSDYMKSGSPEHMEAYLRELVFSLQTMYEDIAVNVNGAFLSNFDQQRFQWVPTLKDTADSTTTFTYDHQVGWAFRQGLLIDLWFDIQWTGVSAGTTNGNMYIDLPFEVIDSTISTSSTEKPFVGVLQPSAFAYTAGTECVINAIPNTYRGEIWNVGDGFTTANQGSTATGQLIGHIRYIGVENEG